MTSSESAPTDTAIADTGHATDKLPVLVLGAIGVVYGDIGTSPIYAFREALGANAEGGAAATTS